MSADAITFNSSRIGKAGLTGPAFFRFRGGYPIYTWAMKHTCALLLICLLLAACGGDEGADSPEQAATNFLEALQSGDREDIYAAVTRAEGESFQKIDDRLDYNRWDGCNIEEFKIVGTELDGNRAKVTVLITREINDQPVQGEEMVVCVQERNRWRVTMSASSKLFVPSGKKPE